MNGAVRVRELTARGRGAIRVLELSGAGALERLERLASRARLPAPGEFAFVALRDARGTLLDEALVVRASPVRVELHLHGAPALVERILAELELVAEELPARTIEERAEARLAGAASDSAARVLLDQAQGALRAELEALLLRPDPDLRAAALSLARRGRAARWLLHPPRAVLAGPVNAGKSTLFNVLVGRERVLVDASAGTTRDAVHERIQLCGHAVDLHDSAGERALTGDELGASVERAGQALAAELRGSADLVLWLVPPGERPPARTSARTRIIGSCADLLTGSSPDWPTLSALHDPARARQVVEEVVRAALDLPRVPWVPGTGVPFEPEWIDALEDEDSAAVRRAILAWLASGPD